MANNSIVCINYACTKSHVKLINDSRDRYQDLERIGGGDSSKIDINFHSGHIVKLISILVAISEFANSSW